jgi:hypothetical protein
MNCHIINIPDENYFLNTCITNGFLGAGIYVNGTSPQGLSIACKTSYSMYADMKTIRVGDMIFVHAGTKIYGAFRAESEFMEDNAAPNYIKSNNIHYQDTPGIPNSGWRHSFRPLANVTDYRRIAISQFTDSNGTNLSFTIGIDPTELFDLKYKNKIFSISEKWKYPDSARTIRPLMEFEAYEILKLIEIENADTGNRFTIVPFNLQNYSPINFILNPNIIEDEKIIEGWICSQIGRNQNVDSIFSTFTSFGNNVPIGYLKHMDILGYKELRPGTRKYRVVEVKKDDCVFPDNINQLVHYVNKAATNLANGDFKLVEGYLVTRNFNQDSINFVTQFNQTGRKIRLVQFQYSPPAYNQLQLTQII